MSLPFFDLLQKYFPRSCVDIIVRETIQDIFLYHPVIRTLHPFSKSRVNGLFGLFRYGKSLKKHEEYTLFITLAPSFSSALMGYAIGSPFRVGYKSEGRSLFLTHSFPQKSGIHRVQLYCSLLQHFSTCFTKTGSKGLPENYVEFVKETQFHFSLKEQHTSFFSKPANVLYLVFNVNSEAQSRRLPLATWTALGNKLLSDHAQKKNLYLSERLPKSIALLRLCSTSSPKKICLTSQAKPHYESWQCCYEMSMLLCLMTPVRCILRML